MWSTSTRHLKSFLALILLFSLFGNHSLTRADSKELAYLMTYGSEAATVEGDDDFLQVIFIKVPAGWTQPLWIRIFDADCGGRHDEQFSGRFDTRTRFRLYGGRGAFFRPDIHHPQRTHPDLFSGKLLAQQNFGVDSGHDDRWYNWHQVVPDAIDAVDGSIYYKIIVEGLGGNDGNAYLINVSAAPGTRPVPPSIGLFSYKPTIRLPRFGVFSEMRFFVDRFVRQLTVFNFDLSGAKIGVDTEFRSNLPVPSSGQDQWLSGKVRLNENETGRLCAIRFEGGREMPNDGTFYVADNDGRLLPIKLTIYLQTPNLRPTPRVVVSAAEDCRTFVFDATRSVDHEGDAMAFTWDFGDGTTGRGATVRHRYPAPGQYGGQVVVRDDSGQIFNSIIHRFTVSVNHPPMAIAKVEPIGAPGQAMVFDAGASRDPDGRVVGYRWQFGDGDRRQGRRVTHVYRRPGIYTATLRVTDDSGSPCPTAEASRQVIINDAPVARIDSVAAAAVGESILLSAKASRDTDGRIISYEWNLGDWSRKSGPQVTHAYQKPGTYELTLTVTDDSGARNQSVAARAQIKINAPPLADAGGRYKAAAGETIRFDASRSYDPDGRITAYEWDFGDGRRQKTSGATPYTSHQYAQPGQYRVTLKVTDDSGTRSAAMLDSADVLINHPPVAEAGPDRLGVAGEVQFNAGGSRDSDGHIIAYDWDFGDGQSAKGVNPRHVYRQPGTYRVRLTVTDDSQTSTSRSTDELQVTVNHLPIADAGQDRIGVPGQPLLFDASLSVDPDGEITDFRWDFGDGSQARGIRVNHRYMKPGRYTAFLTVGDNSGRASAVGFDGISVHINQPPVAVAGSDLLVATDQPVVFDAQQSYDPDGRINEYRWEFSDGQFSRNAVRVKRSFSEPGVYTATLIVLDDLRVENSTSQDKLTIRVNHPPVPICGEDVVTASRTVMLDASRSTDADGDVLSYTWDFGDGTAPQNGPKVYHTYTKGGHYPVALTVDDGNGLQNSRSSTSISVKINEPPIADAGGNRTVCAGKPVIFDGSRSTDPEGGRLKYSWDFGDGDTSGIVNPVKTYKEGGIYLVNLTVSDDSGLQSGAEGSDQVAVTVIESPVADAGMDQTVCAGSPVQFNGSRSRDVDGLVNHFEWNFGDGTIGSGPFPTHSYTEPGIYYVSLTITGDQIGDCINTDADQMTVTVEKAPLADFSGEVLAEHGRALTFDASSSKIGNNSDVAYHWNFGDGTRADGRTVVHTYAKPGTYIVNMTLETDAQSSCNQATKQKQVTINASPLAKAAAVGVDAAPTGEYLAAASQIIVFDGTGSMDSDGIIATYHWDFGDGHSAEGAYVHHQYSSAGTYPVVLTIADNAGVANSTHTDSLLVRVNDAPTAVIEGDGAVCPGQTVEFNARGSSDSDGVIEHFWWDFGDGSPRQSGKEVRHSYRYPGNYTVLLEVDDGRGLNNSRSQATAQIRVHQPPQIDAGNDRLISTRDQIELTAVARQGSLPIAVYHWDLGDGKTASGKKVVHRYDTPGRYQVHLKVEDDSGSRCNSAEDMVTIRVNASPVAVIDSDREAMTGGANDGVLFDGSDSYDPDGDPLTFRWDFGDGHQGVGPKVFHRYAQAGRYTVTLHVDDGQNLKSSTGRQEVTVRVRQR